MNKVEEIIKNKNDEKKKKDIDYEIIEVEKMAARGMNWDMSEPFSEIEQVLNEAKKWIGLIPMNLEHVRKFTDEKDIDEIDTINLSRFDRARHNAAKEFFIKELDMNDIIIEETKISKNAKEGIMWAKVGDTNRNRIMAQIGKISKGRKLDIRLIPKIPHQLWLRNKQLEQNCAAQRKITLELRTQVRLGKSDLELRTKFKGEIYWIKTPIEAYGEIPEIELKTGTKTPEGRRPKRGANTPLANENDKKQNMGNTPERSES